MSGLPSHGVPPDCCLRVGSSERCSLDRPHEGTPRLGSGICRVPGLRYHRLHWRTRDDRLNGRDSGDVDLSVIMERRKSLEWILDAECDWDDVPDHT